MNRPALKPAAIEPGWTGVDQMRRSAVPAGMDDWLWDTTSLTARLKRYCPHGFHVRLLRQGWGRPLYSEMRLLGMRRGETAIVREVELYCEEKAWVFARTVIPASSLRGPARRLTMLGTRPLGEVLFNDPHMRPGRREVARLLPRHPLFQAATASLEQEPGEIWGRRTLFHLSGSPLLVNEIFLPGIPL